VTDTFKELGQSPSRLLAVGGGTRNALWLQATSDVTGIDQIVCEKTVGASYGDAFMAALAIGQVQRSDMALWNPAQTTINAYANPVYDSSHTLFLRLYEQTKDIARELRP
jgi:xylulokinase